MRLGLGGDPASLVQDASENPVESPPSPSPTTG